MARKVVKVPRQPLEYAPHPAMQAVQKPDLIDELMYEHRHMERLWTELQRAHRLDRGTGTAADAARVGEATQQEYADSLVQALSLHEEVELDVLYPAAAEVMNEGWADHARDDHGMIHDLIGKVAGQDPGDERIFELFTEALGRVVAHIEEEERMLFPVMRLAVPRGQLTHPGHPEGRGLIPGHPEFIDMAAAERQFAGTGNGNGRKAKRRLGLIGR